VDVRATDNRSGDAKVQKMIKKDAGKSGISSRCFRSVFHTFVSSGCLSNTRRSKRSALLLASCACDKYVSLFLSLSLSLSHSHSLGYIQTSVQCLVCYLECKTVELI